MKGFGPEIVMIVCGVIGLAVVAVILSKNAQTSTILTSGGTSLSSILAAATSPLSSGSA